MRSPSADVFGPALGRTIHATARKSAARITQTDRREAQRDIEQDLCVITLEAQRTHRGDNGAQLATYCYQGLRLGAYRSAARHQTPAHVPKNRVRDAWTVKQARSTCTSTEGAPGEELDRLEDEEEPADEQVERARVIEHVNRILRAVPEPEAVSAVLLAGESAQSASERLHVPLRSLKKALSTARTRIENDQHLATYARRGA